MAQEPYTPPGEYYVYPGVGDSDHQILVYDEGCNPCSYLPWDKYPFYTYVEDNTTTPPSYYYLETTIDYFKNINGTSTKIGSITAYYKFKRHKLCNDKYSQDAILIDIWKICFTLNTNIYPNPSQSDLISIAPSIQTMLREVHKEIGTHLKKYFHFFAFIDTYIPGGTSDWWKNYVWGEETGELILVFLTPCSMQTNYITFDNGATYKELCYEKRSDNCCMIYYKFQNTFEAYNKNGIDYTCTNHWTCIDRDIMSQNCNEYNILNCKPICSSDIFYFEIGNEYIKDYFSITPNCPVCNGYIPYPKASLFDKNELLNQKIGQVKIYNSTGELITSLDNNNYLNFEFDNSYSPGLYFIQIFDKEMKFIANRKYLVK
jgi:hypothetical protein